MSDSTSELRTLTAETLLLPMTDMAHMFNAPLVDPLSPGLPEVLGISGAEYLLSQPQIRRQSKADTVTVLLPEDKVVPDLSDRTHQALQRYAEFRIRQQQTRLRETRRYGWRVTAVALGLLSIFLALSSFFASEVTQGMPPLLRRTLEYGFEIIGWVMLWHPTEILVVEPLAIRDRITALRKLRELRVVIQTAPATIVPEHRGAGAM